MSAKGVKSVKMSNIWFTADTHFDHANVIRYCNRPFSSVQEMNGVLIANWNEVVKPQDTIYHLGDFSLSGSRRAHELISKLNGYKILIRGNHDKGEAYYKSAGFAEYYTSTPAHPVEYGEFFLSHYPYWECYDHDERKHKFADRMLHQRGNRWLLCGHIHEKWKRKGFCINVGVDQWNFAPVSIEQIRTYKESLKHE